jgi:hypothetical protein
MVFIGGHKEKGRRMEQVCGKYFHHSHFPKMKMEKVIGMLIVQSHHSKGQLFHAPNCFYADVLPLVG